MAQYFKDCEWGNMSSVQPRKQRVQLRDMGFHLRRKIVSAHLSKELRSKYNTRSIPVRKGDEVKIVRGSFKDKKGKISKVDLRSLRVNVEGITRKKTDGTVVFVPISPSNLMITEIDTTDPKRMKASSKEAEENDEEEPKPVEKKTAKKKEVE